MQRAHWISTSLKAVAAATLSFAALSAAATTAQAQERIVLNFEGSANVSDPVPGQGPGDNLVIDFLTNGAVGGPPTGTVVAIQTISGAFMPGVMVGTVGTITDLVTTTSGFTTPAPGGTLLSIGGYTFTLDGSAMGNAFGPISLFQVGSNTTAAFAVNGLVSGGNFGAVPRTYQGVFSAQFAGETPEQVFNSINSGGTRSVAFSAEISVGQVVPEPSTYALMASGLGALGLVARRRRQQA